MNDMVYRVVTTWGQEGRIGQKARLLLFADGFSSYAVLGRSLLGGFQNLIFGGDQL